MLQITNLGTQQGHVYRHGSKRCDPSGWMTNSHSLIRKCYFYVWHVRLIYALNYYLLTYKYPLALALDTGHYRKFSCMCINMFKYIFIPPPTRSSGQR